MKNSIKTFVVVLSVILLCGGLLAILSDLLYVSDDEKIQRAIDSIYTEQVTLKENIDVKDYTSDVAEIKGCYLLDNGDYLVKATGKKGYSNGTVTVYVAIEIKEDKAVVKKVVLDSYKGQTLMSKLTDLYAKFTGKTSENGFDDVKEIATGATHSSTATSNAVYASLDFVKGIIGG